MIKRNNNFSVPLEKKYLTVLLITLFIFPLSWGLGIYRIPLEGILPGIERPFFWSFVLSIFILHWTAFILIYWITHPNWAQLLNISMPFFKKNRLYLLSALILFSLMSALAPQYLYSGNVPAESLTLGEIGPVSNWERLVFILLSLTAGICEEVVFRGYGISVLEQFLKNKALALVISSLAFMSLHGLAFLPWFLLIQYFVIGLIFGYIFQRYRRLEILILLHAFIDILVAVSVP